MANGTIHDQISDQYLQQFNRSIGVSGMQKLMSFPELQKLGYNGQLSHLKNDFHGLADFKSQMDKYSSSHIILKIAWSLIKYIVPNNVSIQRLLMTTPGLGTVGKAFQSIHNFGQVFSLSPSDLLSPATVSSKASVYKTQSLQASVTNESTQSIGIGGASPSTPTGGSGSITESQVINLIADLALKAPLASPALTGIPTAPTAANGTNTTQIATTAFVLANAGAASSLAGLTDVLLAGLADRNLLMYEASSGKWKNKTLIAGDIPNLDASKIVTGTLALARGGTNSDLSSTGGTSFVLRQSTVGAAITVSQLSFSDISGTATSGQIPNLDASKITTGLLSTARGGTGVDLSATGGTTKILAQDASHVISARDLVAADIPNLDASKITTGQVALARGGTNADLSGTGGTSQVLKQSSVGAAITVGQLSFSDISGTAASGQIPNLDASKITTGTLALARGGTNADLSATGGASQVLRQSSSGAAITVSQLASSDLSNSSNIALLNATNAFTGSNSFSQDLTASGTISPTTLSGNVNDYNPSGFSTAFTVRINPGASNRNITGLQAGVDGRIVVLENVGSGSLITLVNQSSSSSSANRFKFVADVVLQSGASAALIYDNTTGAWRHFNRAGINNIYSLADNSEVRIGSTTNILGNTSRLYIFGGAQGCNVDVQGDGSTASSDQAVVEVESSDYNTSVDSIFMKFGGPTAIGTTLGISNQLLGQLTVGGSTTTAFVIQAAGAFPIVIGTAGVERSRITSRGEFQIKNSVKITGAMNIIQVATPGAPTVSPHNGASSTWAYKVVAYDNLDQPTLASSAGQTTTGADTLDSTHYNTITWTEIDGALYYKIFRTTVATSPTTTGVIGTVDSGVGTLRDNGLAGDSSSVPSANTTGREQTFGVYLVGSSSGSTLLVPSSTASGVLTLPAATDTLVAQATTDTLTNKRITQRVVALSDATSFTLSADTADMNTQANTQSTGTLTANAPSGTPTDGQKLIFRIKSTNVQTYSWNAIFRGSTTIALPVTSSGGGKTDYLGFIYNNADSKWDIVAYDAGHS